jgi:hypothetical protein
MTSAEACFYLDHQDWSFIVRSLLMYEVERVRQSDEPIEPRTLRSLWYTLIKPALEKLGALEPEYYTPDRVRQLKDAGNIPDWDGLTSKYLAELVKLGVTTYEELNIIDGSRPRRAPAEQSLSVKSVGTVGVHYPNILLFTEKDTIYSVVEAIAALYGVGVLSGSGQPALAATENLIKDMVRHPNFATGGKVYILILTDYDQHGYSIARSAVKQVRLIAGTLPEVDRVEPIRIGLLPDQLTPEERQRNSYSPTRQGFESWFKETGGVDGQRLGLELDALPISRVRQLFITGLQQFIDSEKPYHKDLAKAFIDLLVWDVVKPGLEQLQDRLKQAIDADSLVDQLQCPDDIMAQFALAGFSHIDPLEYDQHVFKAADGLRAQLLDALEQNSNGRNGAQT